MLLITSLPDIMRKEGWATAAACMERWFRNGPHALSPDEKSGGVSMDKLPGPSLALDILTMDWALGFARVGKAMDELVAHKWNNPAARAELFVKLRAWQTIRPPTQVAKGSWDFGDLTQKVPAIDANFQVNYISVGAMTDPLDDFYGAVGRATLKVAVSGNVTNGPDGRPKSIEVKRLGIYLRDSYDFVGDQFLGLWSEEGVDRSRGDELLAAKLGLWSPIAIDAREYDETAAKEKAEAEQGTFGLEGGYMPPVKQTPAQQAEAARRHWRSVSNADFQRYRGRANKGGDYINVSDIHTVLLPLPITVTFG